MVYTVNKGHFCSGARLNPNKPLRVKDKPAYLPTCHEKIFPVVTFVHEWNETCNVVMANGPNDQKTKDCIQLVLKSNQSGKAIDWLIYDAHGMIGADVKGLLEEDCLELWKRRVFW